MRLSFSISALFIGTYISVAAVAFPKLSADYEKEMLPLLKKFCLDCHSTEEQEGELDLERFSSLEAVRKAP